MFFLGRLRSSVAVALVTTLLGVLAAPLTLCTAEEAHCPLQAAPQASVAQAAASHHTCQQSEAPRTALTCCCDDEANIPGVPATAPDVVSAAPTVLASAVDVIVLSPALRLATDTSALTVRHRPLFELFSAFLI